MNTDKVHMTTMNADEVHMSAGNEHTSGGDNT